MRGSSCNRLGSSSAVAEVTPHLGSRITPSRSSVVDSIRTSSGCFLSNDADDVMKAVTTRVAEARNAWRKRGAARRGAGAAGGDGWLEAMTSQRVGIRRPR